MDERIKAAFDFASETTKQLITLATGIVALTVTFSGVNPSSIPGGSTSGSSSPAINAVLLWAWIIYLTSIICGVWTLMALTGSLEPINLATAPPSIRSRNITIPALLQMLTFILATGFIVRYGWLIVQR